MFVLNLIPDLAFSATVAQVDIEGGTFNVLDEVPTEFAFTWSARIGDDPAKAQLRVDGRVVIPLARIETEAAGRAYRTITIEALSRYFKKVLRAEIRDQIQKLVRKEPTP